MSSKKKYYQITTQDRTADINIYGDITSWPWINSDVSAYNIKTEIDALDVDNINVYINSYGGEVAEALAIYNSLRRHNAKVHTFCDGFACSAASVVFCAGDIRTMSDLSLLMVHNCMSYLGFANSNEMRKAAEDNDKINQASIEAYKKVTGLSEDEIRDLMDATTWLTPQEALDYGFATEIVDQEEADEGTQQSAFPLIRDALLNRGSIDQKLDKILAKLDAGDPDEEDPDDDGDDPDPDEEDPDEDDEEEPVNMYKRNFMKLLGVGGKENA